MNGEMNYETILAWLEAKKAALDQAIAGVRTLMGLEQQPGSAVGPALHVASAEGVQPGLFLSLSIADATKKYLSLIKQPQATAEICEALKRGGLHSTAKNYFANVYTILVRQEKQVGDIVRVDKKWGLVEWFPNYRKRGPKEKDASKEEPKGESAKPDGAEPQSRKAPGGNLRDRAKRALSDAGKPMKAADIAAVLETKGTPVHKASLEAALSYLTKHDGGVHRVKPGVYALN
jgi:hypothetical protein